MLDRLSDFYRIVNPNPSDAVITQRRASISTFLEDQSKQSVILACIDLAAFSMGPNLTTTQSAAAQLIVSAIQVEQPSFPSDIAASALEIRVFAGIAVAEYLEKHYDDTSSALIMSALATRTLPAERYLSEFLIAFVETARNSLEESGRKLRERSEITIQALSGADLPGILKSIKTALDDLKDIVNRNLQADREELQILWWVFSGHSTTVGKPFGALAPPKRVLASASELAELAMMPPAENSAQFLQAILKEDHRLTLRQLIDPIGADLLESVARHRTKIDVLLKNHPALLPIIWLCSRRIDGGMTPGWEAEFEQKTHISREDERDASKWATQIFNECVATRLFIQEDEEEQD